jgi:hypothetical protein
MQKNAANRLSLIFAVIILLLTFYLDMLDLPAYPPGISYDESVNVVDAGHVLESGQLDMIFYGDGRVEFLYRVILALFGGVAGQSIFVFRMAGVFIGVLTVAAAGGAARALFLRFPAATGHLALMGAMTGLALNQGFLTLSRSLYRAVPAPLLCLMFLALLWRGLYLVLSGRTEPRSRRALLTFAGAGLAMGLNVHMYTSSLFAVGLVGIVGAHLVVFHIRQWRRWLPGLIIMAVVLGIFLAPMLYLSVTNRERVFGRSEVVRSEENTEALRRLIRLQDTEYVDTFQETMRIRYLSKGDVNAQYNTARVPLMPRGSNPLFYAAIILCVLSFWRYESTQVFGLLILSIIPVTLGSELFHGLRVILGYSVVPLLIGMTVGYAALFAGRWRVYLSYSRNAIKRDNLFPGIALWGLVLVGLLVYASLEARHIADSYQGFFDNHDPAGESREQGELSIGEWYFRPQHREVAAYILSMNEPVYLSAWDMNNPMLRSELQQQYPHTRTWADLPQPLDLPAGKIVTVLDLNDDYHVMVYLHGDTVYILPPLTDANAQSIRDSIVHGEAIVSARDNHPEVGRVIPINDFSFADIHPTGGTIFGGRAQVTGYTTPQDILPGQPHTYCLLWERTRDIARNHRALVQVWNYDSTGITGVESDLLRWLYPTTLWRADEQIPTCHALTLPQDSPPGIYWLAAGIFEPNFPFWEARDINGNLISDASAQVAYFMLPRPENIDIPEPEFPLDAQLGATISLLGYDLITADGTLDLTLYWNGTAQASYTIFVHVEDANAQIVAQQDSQPEGGRYPTLIWSADEVVVTQHHLDIAADSPITVYAGMYSPVTLDRLPVTQNGQSDPNQRIVIFETTGISE